MPLGSGQWALGAGRRILNALQVLQGCSIVSMIVAPHLLTYLLIQIDVPKLWVQAEACRVDVTVSVVPAVLDNLLHSGLEPGRHTAVLDVVIKQREVEVDLS